VSQRQENAELATRPNAHEFAANLQHALNEALERERMLLKKIEEMKKGGG